MLFIAWTIISFHFSNEKCCHPFNWNIFTALLLTFILFKQACCFSSSFISSFIFVFRSSYVFRLFCRNNYWSQSLFIWCLCSQLIILVYQYPSNQALLQHKATPQDNPQLSVIRKFDEIYQQQHRYQLEQPFVHYKQQNHSFRITNTYARENFLRSQETNSFRIPQGDWHEWRKNLLSWSQIETS